MLDVKTQETSLWEHKLNSAINIVTMVQELVEPCYKVIYELQSSSNFNMEM